MAKRWRRKVLLAKIETTSGTAEATVPADAVLIVSDVELTPVAGETVSREIQRPYFGASEEYNVNVHQTLAFSVEMAGSGTAGTAPPWGPLLRACGMAETLTARASAAYAPISTGEPTLTIRFLIDGVQHVLTGCRGTWELSVGVNAVPRFRFTFTGKWEAPADVNPMPGTNYAAWKKPVLPSNANTPTFTLHGTDHGDLALTSLTLDYGVQIVHREAIGAAPTVSITDRLPSGQMVIDAPNVATFAVVDKAKTGATGALQLIHGTAAGAKVEIDMPKVSLSSPSYQEADGIWQTQLDYRPLPNAAAGNDEIKITAK